MANNISVTNVTLENFNETEGWVHIQCNISWQNSWRIDAGPSNWDAAWVFAKYRANSGPWRHVTLSANNTSILTPNFTIDVSTDNKGAFIYRSSISDGTSTANDVRLGWDLTLNGIDINDTVEVKVFAIEMVYVPEGAFYVGGGGNETDQLRMGTSINNNPNAPYLIDSENEISIGTTSSDLYYDSTLYGGDQQGPIPASFPKGFNAFYCMKYEISEQQYVEFFNTVDPNVKSLVDITGTLGKNSDSTVDGNTVSWLGPGIDATTMAPNRACSYITGTTLLRYLGWAGLRPMTEFEFEKAARGPGFPLAEAYAWGSTSIITLPYDLSTAILADGTITLGFINGPNRAIDTGRANYIISSQNDPQPFQCGIFAYPFGFSSAELAGITNERQFAGASYYGIMELSGNLMEPVIGIGNSNGRSFTGNYISTVISGFLINFGITTHIKGGGWNSDSELLKISDRTFSGTGVSLTNRLKELGGRGIRGAND